MFCGNIFDQSKSYAMCRELHGRRLRVEPSHGLPRGREGKLSISGRRPFHPSDRCYNCGESGHYAYDCDLYTRRRRER